MQITEEQIEKFWKAHKRFLKTTLTTEKPHPKTHNLSNLCQTNLSQAIQIFHEVELNAIKYASNYVQDIFILKQSIEKCLNQNGNIYLVGCGASARLAVLLRRLWEISNPSKTGRVISICAAGDISLIKSIEQFEDSKDYGIKQLEQQSFTNNDLLIGLTASGESPFILACIEHAKNSIHTPWLVCNNSIKDIFERNPKHIAKEEHLNILSLNVGEMALTGSTRLQATTAMQLAVGLALIGPCNTTIDINRQISYIYDILYSINLAKLDKLIELESNILTNKEYILYQTDNNILGLSMLADLTERSPTFNIAQFENYSTTPKFYSPFYLSLTHTNSANHAWQELLNKNPACLNWGEFNETTEEYLYGFDISQSSNRVTGMHLPKQQFVESWLVKNETLTMKLKEETINFTIPQNNNLCISLIYKLLLNTHSTLMFGRCGYYEGNLMISLTPSNFKLIDRAIRYSDFILKTKYQKTITYEEIAEVLFNEISTLEPNQSIVNKVINRLINVTTLK